MFQLLSAPLRVVEAERMGMEEGQVCPVTGAIIDETGEKWKLEESIASAQIFCPVDGGGKDLRWRLGCPHDGVCRGD